MLQLLNITLLGPAVGRHPIKFILPEYDYVLFRGKRGAVCVRND